VEYLGLGIGAASYLKGYRFKNTPDRQCYIDFFLRDAINGSPHSVNSEEEYFHPLHEEIQRLSIEERMEEYMFLGLRLKKGVTINDFEKYFGKTMDEVYGYAIDNLKRESLLLQKGNRIFLSQKGTDVANYVMMQFLIE